MGGGGLGGGGGKKLDLSNRIRAYIYPLQDVIKVILFSTRYSTFKQAQHP